MARRANKKFIIILLVSLIVLAAAGGGLYFLAVYKNVDQLIALGDEYVEAGEYKRACLEYKDGLEKDGRNVELMLKYYDAASNVKVESGPPAHRWFKAMFGIINMAVREAPDDPEVFQLLMDLLMKMYREMYDRSVWDAMYTTTQLTLESNPDMTRAKKYKGMAQVNRIASKLNLTDEERFNARGDLQDYLEQVPEDTEAIHHLARWYVLEARLQEMRFGVDARKMKRLLKESLKLSHEALQRKPNDLQRQMNHARILRKNNRKKESRVLLLEIEKRVIANPGSRREILDVMALMNIVEAISKGVDIDDERRQERRQDILQRIDKLFEAAAKVHVDDPVIELTWAKMLYQQREVDKALEMFERVSQIEVLTTPIEAYIQSFAKKEALAALVGLMLSKAERMSPSDESNDLIENINERIDEVHDHLGSSSRYNILAGRLFMLRREWHDAVSYFRLADEQLKNKNPDVLFRLAMALDKLTEGGAAIKVLEKVFGIPRMEKFLPARKELIRLNMKYRQYAEAERLIRLVETENPEDPTIKAVRVDLFSQTGQIDKALAAVELVDPANNPRVVAYKARLLLETGEREEAIKLLEGRLAEEPTDRATLNMLIRNSKKQEQALAYIRQVKESGGGDESLDQLEKRLSQKMTVREYLVERISEEKDLVMQQVLRYYMHKRFGEEEEANEAFAQAQKMQPNHRSVVHLSFEGALERGDWEQAKVAASQAAVLDLDHAQGMFYTARWESAQRRYELAIMSLTEGLIRRPDFSDGWIMLGEAQRASFDMGGSLTSYRKALELRPDSITALRGIAMVHEARQEFELALEAVKQTHKYRPDDRGIRHIYAAYEQQYGDKQQALALRRKWAVDDPEDMANRRSIVLLLADLNRFREAQEMIDHLMSQQGSDLANVLTRSKVHAMQGDVAGAQRELEAYVKGLGDEAAIGDWLTLGRFLLEHDVFEPAISAYKRAISLEDQNMAATVELAGALNNRNEFKMAAEYYQRIYEHRSDNPQNVQEYIEVLVRLNQLDEAEKLLKRLISDHGVKGSTYLLEAMIALVRGNREGALAKLDQAEKVAPQLATVHLVRGQLLAAVPEQQMAALESINRTLELDSTLIRARILRAMLLELTGDIETAMVELQGILSVEFKNKEARVLLASLYIRSEESDEARRLLNASWKMFPNDNQWPKLMAQLAQREGRLKEAAQQFEQVFKIAPSVNALLNWTVSLNSAKQYTATIQVLRDNVEYLQAHPLLNAMRGWALGRTDQVPEAKRAFEIALRNCRNLIAMETVSRHIVTGIGRAEAMVLLEDMSKTDHEVLATLVLVNFQVGNGAYDLALKHLDAIEDKVSDDKTNRLRLEYLRALSLHYNGQYEDAQKAYEQVIEAEPNDYLVLNNLAYIVCEKLGQPEEALIYARRANEANSDNPEVLDTLGWIQYRLGRMEQAESSLRRSTQLKEMASNVLHLALLLNDRDDPISKDEAMRRAKLAKRLGQRDRDFESQEEATKLIQQLQ